MSAYLTIATPMTDLHCLLEALADYGFPRQKVEVYDEATALVGYEGGLRAQQANVVIRQQHVGTASNDLGFLATPTGYRMIVSGYDQARFNAAWQQKLVDRYQYHHGRKMERMAAEERRREEEARRRLVEAQRQTIHEKAKKLGYRVQEAREGEKLRLVLVRRVY